MMEYSSRTLLVLVAITMLAFEIDSKTVSQQNKRWKANKANHPTLISTKFEADDTKETNGTERQIQQWQVALVVPPGLQQQGGAPAPATQGSNGHPPPGSIWIQIPGYYNQNQGPQNPPAENCNPEEHEESSPDEETTETESPTTTKEEEVTTVETVTSSSTEVGVSTETSEEPTTQASTPTSSPSLIEILADCQKERGQWPSSRNCRNFVNCWDGVAYEQSCPGSLLFSNETCHCDYPENVDCGDRPIYPNPSVIDCSNAELGLYRNPANCSEFIVCCATGPEIIPCGRGLDFNEEYGVCDYPQNVDCRGSPSAVDNPWSYIPEDPSEEEQHGNYIDKDDKSLNMLLRGVSGLVRTKARCSPNSITILDRRCSMVALCNTRGYAQIVNCPKKTAFDLRARRCVTEEKARCR